jgi:pyrrolidone-carboxylate peptidase
MKVLITSFGPFKNSPNNPSNEVMLKLQKRIESNNLFSNNITWLTLDVSWMKIDQFVTSIAHEKFDLMIHLGVAINNSLMRIELNAKNNCKGIDIFGKTPLNNRISMEGQDFNTNIDTIQLESFVQKHNRKVRFSEDAGAYLCNYIYYKSLELFSKKSKVLFIHIADVFYNKEAVSIENQAELIEELLLELILNQRSVKSE